ncbi:MAG: hypothetical protein H7061_08180 [Bdellovibrionaceae bacterium]|nr:hypothetical protein [Bdellovibrio sp.]
MRLLSSLLLVLAVAQSASAISIDWAGGYRIEYTEIDRPTLAEPKDRKAYGLNYLHLDPKIVASDGINIVGRFNLFTNDVPAYSNSQLGAIFGGGLRRSTNKEVNVTSETQESSQIRVSQLYLNVNQEYGSLIAGRAPVQFGLGITHNAGLGEFDHWYDTRDMVAYRFIIDNVSLMPMWDRVYQKDFGQGVTISDQVFVMEYDNKDNRASAGVFYQLRDSSLESNDAQSTNAGTGFNNLPGTATPTTQGAWKTKLINLYFGRGWDAFQFKLEASFLTGDTGLVSASTNPNGAENIKYNAYAVASELLFPAQEGKWEYAVKLGMASGDNPETTGVIEGYQFDRNYDVAMLLFNHRMGQRDFLTTGITHPDSSLSVGNSADDESIGNVMYVSPNFRYLWNDKLDLKSTLTWAQLVVNGTKAVDFSKDLGTELDIELIYKPRERVTWSNQIGVLFPGKAWQNGSQNLDSKSNFGIATKAAISF